MSRNTRNTRDCASTSFENVATGAGAVVDVEILDSFIEKDVSAATKVKVIKVMTVLNMATLNRLRKHASIEKCWTWNGRLYALTKNGHTLLVKPFQSVSECLVIS